MEVFSSPNREYEYVHTQTDTCTNKDQQKPVISSAEKLSGVVSRHKNDAERQQKHSECILVRLHGRVEFQITRTETWQKSVTNT